MKAHMNKKLTRWFSFSLIVCLAVLLPVPPSQGNGVSADQPISPSASQPTAGSSIIGDDLLSGFTQGYLVANSLPGDLPATSPLSDPVKSTGNCQEVHFVLGQPAPQNDSEKPASILLSGSVKQIPSIDNEYVMEEDKPDLSVNPIPLSQQQSEGWTTLMTETFEGTFPSGSWTVYDSNGTANGEYFWDEHDYLPHAGSWSAWAANGGANGLDPANHNYPNNMYSWMVYGPFDLSGYTDAELLFYYWNQSEPTNDMLQWLVSADGMDGGGRNTSGDSGGWNYEIFDLTGGCSWENMTGDSSVWIAFFFISNNTIVDKGPFVDDLILRAYKPSTQIFTDVPPDYWAASWISRLYQAGVTGGCSISPLMYCPEDSVTRAQMAVFIERGIHGSTYIPPAGTGTVFADVPLTLWAVNWIEKLYADGITSGCGTNPLIYCPEDSVTRSQMAVFLLRAKYGAAYIPPGVGSSTGFNDVPITQ